jgi:hypothetical protein
MSEIRQIPIEGLVVESATLDEFRCNSTIKFTNGTEIIFRAIPQGVYECELFVSNNIETTNNVK